MLDVNDCMFYVSGDEMFSDTYKMKLIDGVMYEVYGKVLLCTCLVRYLHDSNIQHFNIMKCWQQIMLNSTTVCFMVVLSWHIF